MDAAAPTQKLLLRTGALAAAGCDLLHNACEDSPNWGRFVADYLKNAGINMAAPWCAASCQFWYDAAALAFGIRNPLDEVKNEAYVQSYYEWAKSTDRIIVNPTQALPGDLVLFWNFSKSKKNLRFDHMGILQFTPASLALGTAVRTIEGNTNAAGGREGDRVASKTRELRIETCFVRVELN